MTIIKNGCIRGGDYYTTTEQCNNPECKSERKPKTKITILEDRNIPAWKIGRFIKKHENDKAYKEDQKASGEDPNSEFDKGFDLALSLLKEELIEIVESDPYK